MAGTLTISTLSDGTNSTSSTNCIQGSAKAWVNFSTSANTPTIKSSFNVSSITYAGTSSNQTIAFTNALPSANYVVAGSISQQYNSSTNFATVAVASPTNYCSPTNKTTTACQVVFEGYGGSGPTVTIGDISVIFIGG